MVEIILIIYFKHIHVQYLLLGLKLLLFFFFF